MVASMQKKMSLKFINCRLQTVMGSGKYSLGTNRKAKIDCNVAKTAVHHGGTGITRTSQLTALHMQQSPGCAFACVYSWEGVCV
uniref:Uncharacterized protein n=1 Tax=Aquila chrysaetos chrysaetos TaxID=223781 RepID=A0A663DMT2_AQUCH